MNGRAKSTCNFPRVLRILVPFFLCAAFIAALHAAFLNNGFVWLDHGDIEDGRAIVPLSRWWIAFVKPFAATGFYRPLVTLLHSLDTFVWHSWAPGFHCTNLLLFCAAALAAPLFVSTFFPLSRWEQWGAALIAGLHPLGILPAACISYRSESLLALFTFLSVWAYARARSSARRNLCALLFLFTAAAGFSKETAFFYVPAFLFLYEIIRLRTPGRDQHRLPTRLLPAAAGAAGLGLAFVLRWCSLTRAWSIPSVHLTAPEAVATRLLVLGKHLVNLVSPLRPHLCDAVPVVNLVHPTVIAVALVICAAVLILIRCGIRSPAGSSILLIAVGLAPALDLVPLIRFFSPHYAFIAVAPVVGLGVVLVRRAYRADRAWKALALGACLAWLSVAAASTAAAGMRFASDLTLFAPEVRDDGRYLEAWFYLGNYYFLNGDLERARTSYDAALAPAERFITFVDRTETMINRAGVALRQDEPARADSLLRAAQARAPAPLLPLIADNRAFLAARRGDWDSVIVLLDGKEERLMRPEPCAVLAEALRHRGRVREADDMDRRARRFSAASPDNGGQ